MTKFRWVKITGLVILGLLILYMLLPSHLQKGLIYYTADIDDYKIFQNNVVEAGVPKPWLLHNEYNKSQISKENMSYFEELNTIAYLVVQDGKIKHEQYWKGYDEQSLSNSFSMAKTITSLLIGIAIDEGRIESVDQKVGDFLNEFTEGDKANIKIQDLLTMSSGLDWDEAYTSPFSKTTKLYYGKNIRELVTTLDAREEPGKEFKYYSCNTQLLAFVLEEAYGKSLNEIVSEKLWKPLGASYDALWSTDSKDGDEKAYCCFNSNAQDFARLGQLVLNKGKCKGNQIISESYIDEATSPASYLKVQGTEEAVDFYGYQFWILDYEEHKIPYFRGILGQYIFIIPEKNAVVVRLGEKRDKAKGGNQPLDTYIYLDAAFKILDKTNGS